MEYQTLPANSLVAAAVEFLEHLYNLSRDLNTPEIQPPSPAISGRHLQVCTTRKFSISGLTKLPRMYFSPRNYLPAILGSSGINPKDWHEQQTPLRRAWLTLFMRRYDLPEWPAGQRSLGQLDINSTISYQTDKTPRAIGGTVAELHGREALSADGESMVDSLAVAKKEYMQEGVSRLFKGTFNGGAFSSLVLKLIKHLSSDIDFRKLTEERKANAVVNNLVQRGFNPEPMPHVVCMAGTASETRHAANCSIDGTPHKEKASPTMCNGCINGWTNDNYLRDVIAERDRCLAGSQDLSLTSAERKSMVATSNQLSQVIDAQCKLSNEMKASIGNIISSWRENSPMKDFK
jgi:hypothetical protein